MHGMLTSIKRGREIAQMSVRHRGSLAHMAYKPISSGTHEEFANNQQVKIIIIALLLYYIAYLYLIVINMC
jgi:hypothetical protein